MQRDIIYKTETGEVKLGKLIIKYKSNFNGNDIIPPIEAFYDTANIDINRIYQAYKRYRIICSKRVPLTEKERAYLKSIKFINVHNEADWPPFNFNEDGEPKGFSIDFMKLIGRKLNLKINFVSGYSWDQFLQLIKNNRIDVIANIMDIPQRREYINFTIPYLTTKKAIFSNQPNLNYFSDLEGKIVAVPKGFYIEEYLKERYPKIKIKRYKNVLECIVAVLNKEADALVESYSVVNYLLQKNNLNIKYMTISKDKELSSKLSLGVTKSKPILRDILNKAIESITREEFDELKKKWADIKEQKLSILTSEENRYLKSLGYIRVCTSSNQKVTENIKDKNIASGIAIDILKIISDKIDLKMKFIYPKSLKELLEFLKNGDCDLAPGLVYTKERAKYLWFTKPYISYKLALITRDDRPIVTDMYTISDKTMARKEGSALISLMRERYPKLKIIETDSYEEAFSLVKDGKAYFTIATLPILSSYKYQYGLDNLKIAGYLDMRYPFSFAINKDNYLLYSIIEKTLSSIPKKTFQIVSDKWTIFNIVEKTDYIFALKVVIAFSIIIFLLLYAYLKLKRLHNKIHHLNQGLERRVKEEIEKNRTKEKMLLHQDRLAKMGEILSMIAHQWRQPLNNLSIINQILVIKYNRGELNQHVIDKFKRDSSKQITLMSKTIDDFKNFFKPEKDKQVFNIGELLNEMIDMLKPVIQSSDIKIDLDIDESIEISGYRNELGQSLLNIINNAKDALVANKKSNRKIEIKIKREAKKVVISIADNAGGIPENILDKICEPYFSTKSNKNGTGLGLYMSRIIIEDYMRGELKISNRDEGALFEIILESTT
jgi:polar amino acid transport system substrate-binding protein